MAMLDDDDDDNCDPLITTTHLGSVCSKPWGQCTE